MNAMNANSLYDLQVKLPEAKDFSTIMTGAKYDVADTILIDLVKAGKAEGKEIKRSNFRIVKSITK